MSDSLPPHGLQAARLLCPQNFPGKTTGVGCHFLLQGIFLTQGLNPCLLSTERRETDRETEREERERERKRERERRAALNSFKK